MRFGDKAYDKRKNFNILDEINAEPAISIERMHPIPNIVNELKLMYDDIVEWQIEAKKGKKCAHIRKLQLLHISEKDW